MIGKEIPSKNKIYFGLHVVCLIWFGTVASGCFFGEEWDSLEPVTVQHALNGHTDCGSFEEYAKQSAIQLMRAQVEVARNQDAQWSNEADDVGFDSDESGGDADGDGDSDSDFSQTNVQEQGVDEADLTKTDGSSIFALHLGELVIVDADEDGQLEQTGRAEVGGYADELFIYGDLAVVFSTLYENEVPEELHYYRQDEPYGMGVSMEFDCWDEWCYGNHRYSQIALVDISDRTAPQVVRTIIFAGQYETSRRIDNALRAVIHSPLW